MNILAVGTGGFLGAVLRYLIGKIIINENMVFPIKTFAINAVGCLVIGLIAVLATKNTQIDQRLILFLKVGFCGGFTTFSTFALETTDLIKGGHIGIALLYAVLSMAVGCAVIFDTELITSK